jgi:hypothetical protein
MADVSSHMVTIRQHGDSGELFDLQAFAADLEPFRRSLDYWTVNIEECIGQAAPALVELTSNSPRVSPQAFDGLRGLIDQTIDGEFVGYQDGREVVRLLAIDSSCWEISGPPEFETAMLTKYGAYKS